MSDFVDVDAMVPKDNRLKFFLLAFLVLVVVFLVVLFYPSSSRTNDIEGCTFFHSSFGVETYQGFKLVPVFPSMFEYNGELVFVDSSVSMEYLSISILNPDVLLSPTYVKFTPNWSQKVCYVVHVDKDAPVGLYATGFDVAPADPLLSAEWRGLFGARYVDLGGIRADVPQFIVVVRVT